MIKLGPPSRYQLLFDWFCQRPNLIVSARDVRRALPNVCDASVLSVLLGQCARDHKFLTKPKRGLYQFRRCSLRPVTKGWKSASEVTDADDSCELAQRVVRIRAADAPVVIDPILSAPLIRRVERCAHR